MQLFGTVGNGQGSMGTALLCVDDDLPDEWMIHLWELEDTPLAVLCDRSTQGELIHLQPKAIFRPNTGNALYLPKLDEDEAARLKRTSATLKTTAHGYEGRWVGPDSEDTIRFAFHEQRQIEAEQCTSWEVFAAWAQRVRSKNDAVIFRGHGDRRFKLTTTIHRHGRTRLERYCAELLPRFKAQAEAVMGMRFNLLDGNDYATILGLAQHHGLPTPLLDWTESPYVAAFFAFADALEWAHVRKDATHVRVFALTRAFVQQTSPAFVPVPQPSPYVASLQIDPIHNPRLLAQQGRFLVTNVSDLETYLLFTEEAAKQTVLLAADLPVELAATALEDLAYMGLHAGTLFPGMDGVCRMLKHEMSFKRRSIGMAGLPIASNTGQGTASGTTAPQTAE